MDNIGFLFSRQEFMVLSAVSGIEKMYGFSMEEKVEEQEVLQAMQALTARNMLGSFDGIFQVQEPVRELFQQIKDAKTMLDVHKRSGKKCILYIGQFSVQVSALPNREGMLHVQKISNRDVWNFLTEEGWIPQEGEERVDIS